MAGLRFPNISYFPNVSEIQVTWTIFSGERESYCLYRLLQKTTEWIASTKVLRFTAACLAGDENDLELVMDFKKSGIVLRVDFDDEGPKSFPLQWFDGPSGLMLDYRTQFEFITILIKPA